MRTFIARLSCATVPFVTQVVPSSTGSGDPTFAAVLSDEAFGANIAQGMRKPPVSDRSPSDDHDLLADDIATISYEQALRTHARSVPVWDEQPAGLFENSYTVADQAATSGQTGFSPLRIQEIALKHRQSERRSASITIRLSRPECDQIHKRAEQAGLTVSAYLRSCVLEAEDLRAQVKKMIAEMKPSQSVPAIPHVVAQRPQSHWQMLWSRLFRVRRASAA
ncbi:MAG: hypothetical protein KGN79_15325 [Acidobacteriota bacterium]|nr:hypothetical protein [Acidobacteriota bacterium]